MNTMVPSIATLSCRLLLLAIPIILVLSPALSQTDSSKALRDSSVIVTPISRIDTSNGKKSFHETKSPWRAVAYSALLPGAGQLYNENYWKVPVIVGLAGYWVYEWVSLNSNYRDFRDQYSQSISPTLPDGDGHLRTIRDFY